MPTWGRWVLGGLVVVVALGGPLAYYRTVFENYRRFRVVTPDRFYRSGQLTARGLEQVIKRHGIKTVVNLQDENQDPFMPVVWAGSTGVRESELCARLGVRYVALEANEITPPAEFAAGKRPVVIDQYLKILDDPTAYPVLLHCRAGLHRTGQLTAIYRMEYEGRTPAAAMEELRANGYGTFAATTANAYIAQYVAGYKPGVRNPAPAPGWASGGPD
jgi:tyrosine-protein phosphatase SIW14